MRSGRTQQAGEIRPQAGFIFRIFAAAGHVGPFPSIGAEGPRHAGKFGGAAGYIGLECGEGIWRDVGIAQEGQAAGGGGGAQLGLDAGVVTLAVSAGEGDQPAGAADAAGFGDEAGQAEIGGGADADHHVGAGIGEGDPVGPSLGEDRAGDCGEAASGHARHSAIAVGAHEARIGKEGMGVEQPAALAAADIEDPGRGGMLVGRECGKQQVIHHRRGLFARQCGQVPEVRRKRKIASVEEAFPADRGKAVQHLIGSEVEQVQRKAEGGGGGGLTETKEIGHRKTLSGTGTQQGLLKTTALALAQPYRVRPG